MWPAVIAAGASLAGGAIKAITGKQARDREYERQKEFAENGIRWKVEDAKAAGIHPIYAIGANTATYSPQAAVGDDFGISEAGQNIARSIEAKQTAEERKANNRVSRTVGEAQANYYNSAARRQDAEADLIGQRSVREALDDIRADTIGQQVASSSRAIRTQQLPPSMPRTDNKNPNGNQGFDEPTPRYDFEFGLNGKRVAIAHSQTMHDKYEDMFLAEYWPVALGLAADARFKLTREPVMAEDGKWYAYNGSYYAPIDISSYRHEWENSVINRFLRHHRSSRYRAGSSISAPSGGGGT